MHKTKDWSFTISSNPLSANDHLSLTWDSWPYLTFYYFLLSSLCIKSSSHLHLLPHFSYGRAFSFFCILHSHGIITFSFSLLLLFIIHTHHHLLPTIFQVQHLIEKCLIFHMSKEECMDALSKHANIKPVITSTGIIFSSFFIPTFSFSFFLFCTISTPYKIMIRSFQNVKWLSTLVSTNPFWLLN